MFWNEYPVKICHWFNSVEQNGYTDKLKENTQYNAENVTSLFSSNLQKDSFMINKAIFNVKKHDPKYFPF